MDIKSDQLTVDSYIGQLVYRCQSENAENTHPGYVNKERSKISELKTAHKAPRINASVIDTFLAVAIYNRGITAIGMHRMAMSTNRLVIS